MRFRDFLDYYPIVARPWPASLSIPHLKEGAFRGFGKRMDEKVLEEYLVFHDCGKPYCREVDQEGRVHFPDHARISAAIWKAIGTSAAATLMGMDMDIHLLKAEGLSEFAERPQATSLLIAGFCEIHSNAAMFGGIESTSFKSKWKHIDRRGRQLVKMI